MTEHKHLKCPLCERRFGSPKALKTHQAAKHSDGDDESMASRSINAELDHAMGIHNPDHDWLVEPYK